MPMFGHVKFPANAMMITKFMVTLATFDLFPTHLLEEKMYYFPDGGAFNLNFETAGIESELFLENIGFILWILMAHLLLALIHLVLYLIMKRQSCKCIHKVYEKLGNYLYWNGLLRLLMEIYFELTLLSILNLHKVDWDTKFISV